jgi:ribosomal protein L29
MKEIKDLKLQSKESLDKMDQTGLRAELVVSEKKYFTLNMKLSLGELKQSHLIKPLRRYIARLKTIGSTKSFNIQ